jgi:hypothetical protein
MKFKFFSIIAIITTLLNTSCTKEETSNPENFNLSSKVLKFEDIEKIAVQVSGIQNRLSTSRVDEATAEAEIREAMLPLIENGEVLHNEIISQIDFSDPNLELTEEEINHIDNMSEQELAQLSLIFSTAYNNNIARADYDMVMNCLGAALGINEVYGLINNTAQLATVEGTKKLVKLLIRRYVGWIGVAVAVYSFSNCMGYF